MRIAVYCSAKADLPEEVKADARKLGRWIGENGHQLVYGGLSLGLMHDVAQAARDAGATVMGVVPENRLANLHPANTVNLLCANLHERKQMMEENSDAFVALDGGLGTLDEIFAALASMTFFREPKPVVMLNRNGLFDPLRQMMANLTDRQLATPAAAAQLQFAYDIDSLTRFLAERGAEIDGHDD